VKEMRDSRLFTDFKIPAGSREKEKGKGKAKGKG
jgi:hypothetical protein